MIFSGLPFLYYFLPGLILVYFLVPRKLRNAVLLLSSLIFYAWGEPKYVLLMAATILIFYGSGLAIAALPKKAWKRFFLILSVAIGIALLGVFKYADFFLSTIGSILHRDIPLLRLALPVGISFYTFQCISYAVDVYRSDAPPQKNIVSFGAYVTMFPQLIAGPIVRYTDVAERLDSRSTTTEEFALGLRRFLMGLGKKVLLANQFGVLTAAYRDSGEKSVLYCWLYALAFLLQIYFDFSGYSDMAIGLGRILGFRFPENFNYPYLSGSVTEFWRRWHMSLGSWFRDYVYIPLGGSRVPKYRWVCNILAVWMLTGLWHGASWNFVLWGLLFAGLLMLEKWIPNFRKLPAAIRHGYVLLAVMLSFVLFNAESLPQAGADYAGMFGLAGLPAVTPESLYALKSNAILLLLGIFGATPLPKLAAQRLPEKGAAILEPLALAGILALSTAYLVDGSFNPFLYFRF